jgi:hypothetical protein
LNGIIGGSRPRFARNGVRKRMRYGHDWRTGCDADEKGEHHRARVRLHRVDDEFAIVPFSSNVLRLGAWGSELFVLFVVGWSGSMTFGKSLLCSMPYKKKMRSVAYIVFAKHHVLVEGGCTMV